MSQPRRAAVRAMELLLLIPAFGFLIPAVTSERESEPDLLPGLLLGVACLSVSLALSCRRGGEHWIIALTKVALFVGFGWLVHQRVVMSA